MTGASRQGYIAPGLVIAPCVTWGCPMRFRQVVSFLIVFTGFHCFQASGQEVVATWTDATGNWSNAANWSTLTVPNNNGGTTYSVVISAPSSAVTLDVLNVTIDNLTLGATNSLNIANGGTLGSSTLTNQGTIVNRGTLGGTLTNQGAIANSGTLSSEGFVNSGTVINANGAFASNGLEPLTNNGTIINAGSFNIAITVVQNNNAFVNAGSFSIGAAIFQNNNAFVNAGTFFAGQSNIFNTGMFTNSGSYSQADASSINGGSLVNTGTFNVSNGDLTNSGTLLNTGTLSASDQGSITNSGTLLNTGKLTASDVGSIANSGTFVNGGSLNISGPGMLGEFTNSGKFTNSGAVTISNSALFTTSTNYTQTSGSTLVNGTLSATGGAIVNIVGGTLGGTATISGNVLMSGTMMPGGTLMPGDSPGTLTIFGNYEQTGTGIFDELMRPFSQAFLDVGGNVVLDPGALLEISLLGGFNPLGSTISIMDFSSLSGQFANGSSFWDDGYLWDITYRQHEIDVTAVTAAPEPSSVILLGIASLAFGVFVGWKKVTQ